MAIAAVVVVLAVVAGVLVVVLRDDDAEPAAGIRAADVLTERQLALVRKAVPDPKCDAGAGRAAGDPSSVALDVMRVDGTCLKVTTEYLPADRVAARRAELAKDPSVVESAVAPLMTTDATPLLPAVEDHRDDQWPLDILGVPKGADRMPWPDGTGAVVAVLDTGIDAAHPDLAGAVIARRDYPGQGAPDPDGHGTHVAGIVAGRSGNGGITGVAPAVSLLDVPVRLEQANDTGPSWLVGLPWAVNHGADAVNMSFGIAYAEYTKPENDGALALGAAAVEFARNSQVVVVAAGGNCGGGASTRDPSCEARDERQLPSGYDDVVAVGAVGPGRDLSAFSSRNDDIDLVAPGGNHGNRPPNMSGNEVLSAKPGGGFARMEGTSQAAPHVAAAAAVARSLRPDATADEIADALVGTADMNGIAKDDRGKTGSGHGLLNIPALVDRLRSGPTASPSGPAPGPGASGSPGAAAARTQAAYVHDGTLYAFDGTTSNPVRRVDPQSPLRWVAWSSDHTLLVGADDTTLFSWAGPGSRIVEKPCDWCGEPREKPALVDDAVIADPLAGTPTADLVMRVSYDGTLTRYSARTLEELGSARAVFPDGEAGDKSLQGTVAGKLIVHASGGAHASERLWLVDPVSGQAGAFHDVTGSVLGGAAVSADGGKVALVTGYGTCGRPDGMYVLAGNDLREIAKPTPPPGVMVDELFFNGGTLLASMATYTMAPGTPCVRLASAGLWQLNGTTWQRVDPSMTAGRPLEGRPGTFPTGWLTVRGTAGAVEPAAAIDLDKGDLGTVQGRVWATPTRTEVPIPPPR
ncbi:S8 family serine peptidase [Uniformispora flossi]|uniref:S8 family serine peptidase n=1 Tax=Uniformispora flossi TaxID=3390723 RepID=UPI003C2AFB37